MNRKDCFNLIIDLLTGDIKMAEVGCFMGDSTILWAVHPRIKTLYAIDPWLGGYDKSETAAYDMLKAESMFDERTRNFSNVSKIKMTSEAASRMIEDESLDMVYIDACHVYESVKKDVLLWYPKVRKGGLVTGHDYYENGDNMKDYMGGVARAVIETIGKPQHVYYDSSWVIQK